MRRANYIVVRMSAEQIELRDMGPWDQFPTITNDAEAVIADLANGGLLTPGRRVFYTDSEGQVDELLVKDGRFAGFAPGPDRTEAGA